MSNVLTLLLGGLGVGSVYALVALGFSFILTTTNSFNFAHGSLVPIGSLLAYVTTMLWGLPAGLAVIVSILVVAALGGLTERIAVFPLVRRGDAPLSWLMSTLGVSVLITGAATRIFGTTPLGVDPYIGEKVVTFGDVYVASPYLIALAAAVLAAFLISMFQRFTPWGRVMRAIADNRDAVRLAGVDVLRYSLASYLIGGGLAAFAGFVIAPVTYASSSGGFSFTVLGFAAMAIGGFASHWGALVGGWLVGLIQSVGGAVAGLQYQSVLVFAGLLLVLLIRPAGLFTSMRARRV